MKNNTRFSICLLFLWMSMSFCLAAETYSQETFFTIESNNLTVKEVFNKIEKESEYIFFYLDNSVDLNRKVSVKARERTGKQDSRSDIRRNRHTLLHLRPTDHHLERRKSRSGQFTTKRTNHHRYRKRCDRRTGHRSQYRRKRNDQRYDYRHERTVHPHR